MRGSGIRVAPSTPHKILAGLTERAVVKNDKLTARSNYSLRVGTKWLSSCQKLKTT